jgi:hypothetical protein
MVCNLNICPEAFIGLEKVYDGFLERKKQRWKAFYSFIALLVIFVFVGIFAGYYAEWFVSGWIIIAGVILFLLFFYWGSREWSGETRETSIFIQAHDASKLLNLVSPQDKNSTLYAKKAAKKLEGIISEIRTMAGVLTRANSTLLNRLGEPLEVLAKNLEDWILPRTEKEKDVQDVISVLRGLARLFSETTQPLSLEDVISKNKDLLRFKISKPEGKASVIVTGWSKATVKFFVSMVFGEIIVFGIAFGHSFLYKYNLGDSLSNLMSFITLIGVGVAIGIGVFEIMRRR